MTRLSYDSLCVAFEGNRKEQLTSELMARYGWSQEKTHGAIAQYLMFLYVTALHRSLHLMPTCEIDCVWEADILQNTQQYVQTCQHLCGEIIHHASEAQIQTLPNFPGVEIAFSQTKLLLQAYFGEQKLGVLEPTMAACGVL